LIFLPNEEVIANEHIIHKDRLSIRILIQGAYTIVSTVDGSQVTVSGTGDGLATGTAVASNIGSTNALKNALLRTFLITEQSVEEAAKNGAPDAPPSKDQQAVSKARAAAPKKDSGVRAAIQEQIDSGAYTREQVNALVTKHAADLGKPKGDASVLEATLKSITAGEVA